MKTEAANPVALHWGLSPHTVTRYRRQLGIKGPTPNARKLIGNTTPRLSRQKIATSAPMPGQYSYRVSEAQHRLRREKGRSIVEMQEFFAERGYDLPTTRVYSWEEGRAVLPWDYVPLITQVYGFESTHDWS